MAMWQMSCTCGDKMQMDGETKEQAADKLMEIMNPPAVAAHMAEKHSGAPIPTQEQTRTGLLLTATPI